METLDSNTSLLKQRLRPLFSTMRVLLVDDMATNLDQYRLILADLGFERANVDTAVNGLIGLSKLVKEVPDLIIADWNMPLMDGYQFVKNIRQHKHLDALILTMVTAEHEKDLQEVAPYINAFERKPATTADLEKMIITAVAKKVADPHHPLGQP